MEALISDLYGNTCHECHSLADNSPKHFIGIDEEVVARAMANIYNRRFNPQTEVDAGLFAQTLRVLNAATKEGFARAAYNPAGEFQRQIESSNAVFSAFKVHAQQNAMASRLLDDKGRLKPFSKWKKEVAPIANHHNKVWLRTEYDTAVIRAHRAADFVRFRAQKDILPNIKWLPTTSHTQGQDHAPFWRLPVILPVDHPFWNEHRPGDRWNCKCSWRSTDEPPTKGITLEIPPSSMPHTGLDNNPATDGRIFNDSHPYFPKSCGSCPLNGTLPRLFANLSGKQKNCYECKKAAEMIENIGDFKKTQTFDNGGAYLEHRQTDKTANDYNMVKRVGLEFARMGAEVKATPKLHFKDPEYKKVYGSLTGTKYERKCPDLLIDGKFYEVESFNGKWTKNKLKRMLSNGLLQSDRIIINNTKGGSDRIIRKFVKAREHKIANILEVWLYEKGKIRLFYKTTGG